MNAAPMSTPSIASNPVFDAAGAGAAFVAHVPTCPGKLHCSRGWSQAVSQQTPSAHWSVEHCEGVEQAPPWGTGLAVGVFVTVAVAVAVDVAVAVAVLVAVPVAVAVAVAVWTGPMLMVKLHELILFAKSTHVHVTVVWPTGKTLPEGGAQLKLLTPPASLHPAT